MTVETADAPAISKRPPPFGPAAATSRLHIFRDIATDADGALVTAIKNVADINARYNEARGALADLQRGERAAMRQDSDDFATAVLRGDKAAKPGRKHEDAWRGELEETKRLVAGLEEAWSRAELAAAALIDAHPEWRHAVPVDKAHAAVEEAQAALDAAIAHRDSLTRYRAWLGNPWRRPSPR